MPYWRGKSILHLGVRWIMLATAVQFAFYAHPLFANPAGASVVNGAVNMQTTGNTLAITASRRNTRQQCCLGLRLTAGLS